MRATAARRVTALALAAAWLLPPVPSTGSALAAPPEARATTTVLPYTPKPTAPIGIAHRFASEPAVGQPLVITLEVTPAGALGDAVLTTGADDALAITDPQAVRLQLGTIGAGQTAAVELTVVPLEARDHYLHVSVTGDIRGQRQTRSVTVAIRLEPEVQRKPASEVAGKSEESVRSLTAVETVR